MKLPARTPGRAAAALDRSRRASARLPAVLAARLRHGRPGAVVAYHGAIGDDLMCTVFCRELRRRGVDAVWMLSQFPDLFAGNPDVRAVLPWGPGHGALVQRFGWPMLRPRYSRYDRATDRAVLFEPDRHILTAMCRSVGIVGPIVRRPYLTLGESEREAGARAPRQVAIQSSGAARSGVAMTNKEWFPERFQQVVTALRDEFDFVQLGAPSDPPLAGALDLRGRTSRRESAAVLSQSLAFVGNVGFLMHLARAVECRSVILFGGREAPHQSGYGCNENLYGDVPCAPCWLRTRCEYGHRCMDMLTAGHVAAAVRRAAAKHGTPLEEDADVVEADGLDDVGGRPFVTHATPFGARRVRAWLPPAAA